MSEYLRDQWARRAWWMNAMLLLCVYMAVIRVPFDLFFTPIEGDEEVWFGIVLRGLAAKLTEPLHWAIYAAGAWGFWRMSRWMWPWAAVYMAQIAIGTLVWNCDRSARQRLARRPRCASCFYAPNDCAVAQQAGVRRSGAFGLTIRKRACRFARTRPARCACLRPRVGSRRTPSVEP